MKRFAAAMACLVLPALLGCTQYRGTFPAVAPAHLPGHYSYSSQPRVTGSACFDEVFSTGDNAIFLAVEDALAKDPNANALALVRLRIVDSRCMEVEGTPVRLVRP